MKELLAGALLLFLLPLTAQEKIYQITKGLEDHRIEETHLLKNEEFVLIKSKLDDQGSIKLLRFDNGAEIEIDQKILFNSIDLLATHPSLPIIAITPSSKIEKTKVVDLEEQKILSYLPIIEKGNISFSPDGSHLGILEDKSIVLFDWKNGTESNRLDMSSSGWIPFKFKFSPNGRLLVFLASRYDEELETRLEQVFLWDISVGRFSQPFKVSSGHQIAEFGFTSSSHQLFLLEKYESEEETSHRFIYWKNDNYKTHFSKELSNIEAFAVSPGGEFLATLEYSYSPLVIRSLSSNSQDIYTSPSPSNYKKIQFSEDGLQLLMAGERLTVFLMGDHSFRTIHSSPKFMAIKSAILTRDQSSILLSDNNYEEPNLTKLSYPSYNVEPTLIATNIAPPATIAEPSDFVQMNDLDTENGNISVNISGKPNFEDDACSPFQAYKIRELEVTNKIVHTALNQSQKEPYGLETIGFSQDEKLMVTYFPSNDLAELYTSQMLLWNIDSRCPIQQFENQKIDDETYILLTRYANEIEVDQLNDQILVSTNEHEFQFDIRSGRLENAYESPSRPKNKLISESIDGKSRAYFKRSDQSIRVEGKRKMKLSRVGEGFVPKAITWCYNDQILAAIHRKPQTREQFLVFTNARTKEQLEKVELNGDDITDLIWLPKTKRLVTVERAGVVRFWDIKSLLPSELQPTEAQEESVIMANLNPTDVHIDEFLLGSSVKEEEPTEVLAESEDIGQEVAFEDLPIEENFESVANDTITEPSILAAKPLEEETISEEELVSNENIIEEVLEPIVQSNPIEEFSDTTSLSGNLDEGGLEPIEEEGLSEAFVAEPSQPSIDSGVEAEMPIVNEEVALIEEQDAYEDDLNQVKPTTTEDPMDQNETFLSQDLPVEASPYENDIDVFPGELTANDIVEVDENNLTQLLLDQEFFRAERAAFELLYKNAADYDARIYLTLAYLFQGKFGKAKLTWYKHKNKILTTGEGFTATLVANLEFLMDNNISHRDARKFKSLIQD